MWRCPTPLTIVEWTLAKMPLSLILLLLPVIPVSVLLNKFHNLFVLEAIDNAGAAALLRCKNISDIVAAILHRKIKIRFYKGVDPDISLSRQAYTFSESPHHLDPLLQDPGEVKDAALSATRGAIHHFMCAHDPDQDTSLYLFIRSVTLSTLLHVFFRLPITSTNIEDTIWIASNTWQLENCWEEPVSGLHDLYRLVKPSPNPSGVFAVLLTMQRLILAAICTLEHRGEVIPFVRRAGSLLRHPTAPEPGVTQLVEKIRRSNPPIQTIHGRLSLRCLPLPWACNIEFLIPVDSLPSSTCTLGPDGTCLSWLHKATLPSPTPECGGEKWVVHTTAIILSAIETEIRNAGLTVDGDGRDPEAWEEWALRRLRI